MFVRLSFFFALAVCLTSESSAQEPSFPQPVAEHEWLKRFEGSWTCESKGKMGPDQPEIQLHLASTRVRSPFQIPDAAGVT